MWTDTSPVPHEGRDSHGAEIEWTRLVRWFWSAIGVWAAVLLMILPGASASTWIAYAAIVPLLGMLFAFDMVERRLPLMFSHMALGIFITVVSVGSIVHGDTRAIGAVVGASALGAFAGVLGTRRELFGRGDVHLCPVLGAMGGWFDPRAVVTIVLVASVTGAVCALIVMFGRFGRRSDLIPYGPFLMVGTMVAIAMSAHNI